MIVATKSSTRVKERTLAPRQGPEARRIEVLLDTPDGAALYRQRRHIIETVVARRRFCAASRDFSGAAWTPAVPEWRLIATGHNLLERHTSLNG